MKLRDRVYERMRLALLVILSVAMLAPFPVFAQSTTGKSYSDANGGFLNETNFVTSGTVATASGGGTVFSDVGAFASGDIEINVTAVTGTSPSMTVNFKSCYTPAATSTAPALANCSMHTASTAITTTGITRIKVDHYARWVTVDYTITGTTPSFTFGVTGFFKPTS